MSEAADNLRGYVGMLWGEAARSVSPNRGVTKEAGHDDLVLDERQGSRAVSLS